MVKKASPPETVSAGTSTPVAARDDARTVVSAEPKAVLTSPVNPASKPSDAPARSKAQCSPGRLYWILLLAVVAIAVALVVVSVVLSQAYNQVKQDAAARSDALAATLQTVERNVTDALVLARTQAATITQLQGALAQMQSRWQALQARTPVSIDAAEAMRVNDVEHLVRQASQQLRLGGQVGNAIIALEIAQSRLTPDDDSAERPEQVLLRQALEDDLMRLRAVPVVDVAARVAQVDRLIALTARAPLLASDFMSDVASDGVVVANAVAPNAAAAPVSGTPSDVTNTVADADPSAPWWQRASYSVAAWSARTLNGLGRDLRGLVSIQRVADPNALLLASDQAAQLRATLRMRLLAAQLALLMGQTSVWQNELASVSAALNRYYDAHAPETTAAVQLARELAEAALAVPLPDVAASLKAAAVLRAAQAYAPTGAPQNAPASVASPED